MKQVLRQELLPQIDNAVKQVYFYGAGCANEAVEQTVVQVLQAVFPEATLEVRSDLWAAARALMRTRAGRRLHSGNGSQLLPVLMVRKLPTTFRRWATSWATKAVGLTWAKNCSIAI